MWILYRMVTMASPARSGRIRPHRLYRDAAERVPSGPHGRPGSGRKGDLDSAGDRRSRSAASRLAFAIPPALVPTLVSWLAHRMVAPYGFRCQGCPYLMPTLNRKSPWTSGAPGGKAIDRLGDATPPNLLVSREPPPDAGPLGNPRRTANGSCHDRSSTSSRRGQRPRTL